MRSMSFLPQELSGAQERSCRLLPSHNGAPLIVDFRKITIGMNIILIEIAEQRLRSRTHAHALLQLLQSAMCYPCNLRRKALYVILFLLKQALRNQHRKVYILHARLFETAVQLMLNVLPDCIACRFDDHAALYACVITQLCFFYNVRIPLREILVH